MDKMDRRLRSELSELSQSSTSMEETLSWYYVICIVGLCFYAVCMLINVYTVRYGYKLLHSYRRPAVQPEDLPGVSIIKPIIGFEDNMMENLESFFQLDYPNYELLVCIAEKNNVPVLRMVKELAAKYPSVQLSLFQGGEEIGVNPKINNMLPAYKSASHNLLWISDSNVKAPSYTLCEMVSHMDSPRVGLVHQLPYVERDPNSFAGYLEMAYFGTQHARAYLIASWLGANCANGMSWLVRRKALEEVGGFQSFTDYLAEDFFMGKALWTNNWKFVLSTIPARQNSRFHSLTNYQARIVRWGRLRATMMPCPGLLEPLTECLGLGLVSCLCSYVVLGLHPLLFLLPHAFIWLCLDVLLISAVKHHRVNNLKKLFLAWLLREFWTIPLFVAGVWSREVSWKGRTYRLHLGGKATKLD